MTAHPDKFELTIVGQEAHGAYPHRGHDAITISAQVIQALQTVVSRRLDPTRAKVLSIGTIQGGTKDNIVAGQVLMTGTLRTFDAATRDALLAEMERACSIARVLGGDYALKVIPGYLPVENNPSLTACVRRVGAEMVGTSNVLEAPLEMGGEDFSYFAQSAPGCLFWLGANTPGEPKRLHHHPQFDIEERWLPLGSALLAEIACQYLNRVSH
jgi:amidohydrolase